MKLEKFIKIGLIISVIHISIVFFFSLITCMAAMDTATNPNQSNSSNGLAAVRVSNILSAPGSWIPVSDSLPYAEMAIVFLNSGLWGFGIAGIVMLIGKSKPESGHRNTVSNENSESSGQEDNESHHFAADSTATGNLVNREQ